VRTRLVARLRASQRPWFWLLVARACALARVVSRRRARWSYRVGYALERAGRLDSAGAAYTTVCELSPTPGYGLPDPPAGWDAASVSFARSLAASGLRRHREIRARDLLQRRTRVVPVVRRATRRRWEQAASSDAAARLHLFYLRHRESYLPGYFGRAGGYRMPRSRVTRAWRWYVGDVLLQSLRLLRRNGRVVREASGVPLHRQLRGMLQLSSRLPAMPDNYYRYEFHRPDNLARASDYLHGHEVSSVLYEMLAVVDDPAGAPTLADKVAFAERAQAHNLPVVPTLAMVEHGEIVRTGDLPAADLFVKPLAGKRGAGADKWFYQEEADAYHQGDGVVRREEFVRWLAGRSAGQALIVQPCLSNHPDLADLALNAVVTCRIVTMTDEDGRPEPVIATFRMPARRDAVVDNMHRGGIAAAVALDSGALGAASDYAVAGPSVRHSRHPVTGALIEGRKLPLWEQVREIVCLAHDSVQPRLLVGWDVSIGPDGPVLLEGNERPGVGGLQRLHETPLGAHRFGELLAHHLTRRFGEPV
jgi:hypothetical protein